MVNYNFFVKEKYKQGQNKKNILSKIIPHYRKSDTKYSIMNEKHTFNSIHVTPLIEMGI